MRIIAGAFAARGHARRALLAENLDEALARAREAEALHRTPEGHRLVRLIEWLRTSRGVT